MEWLHSINKAIEYIEENLCENITVEDVAAHVYSSYSNFVRIFYLVTGVTLSEYMRNRRLSRVGEHGPTHHGAFDLAYLRSIPNLTVASPLNEHELRKLMYTAQLPDMGPFAIRYPRGRGVLPDWRCPLETVEVGKGQCLKEGKDIAVLSLGPIGNTAMEAIAAAEAKSGKSIAHYDLRFLKPLDRKMLDEIGKNYDSIVTIEDGVLQGGMGSAILEFMSDHGYSPTVRRIGLPDKFVQHGTPKELYHICGMDAESIEKVLLSF